MFTQLRQDDRGLLISAELMLGITILFSSTVIGIGTVRDAVVERIVPDFEQASIAAGDALGHSMAVRDSGVLR